jgi:PIN domain nuclease of toxin-antitoxin system
VTPAVVLDTHALLWWLADDARLSKRARRAIERASVVGVSAISMWEVAMLVDKGRVALDRPVPTWANDVGSAAGVAVVPVDGPIAVMAGGLVDFHGDPADRIIVATAIGARASLVTKDDRIRGWRGADQLTIVW